MSAASTNSASKEGQLRSQINLLLKNKLQQKERITELEGRVAFLEEEVGNKDIEITELQMGLQENLAMLEQLEEMDMKSTSSKKGGKDYKKKLEKEKKEKKELAKQLMTAEAKIKHLEDQLALAMKITHGKPASSGAIAGSSNNNNSNALAVIPSDNQAVAFFQEMEALSNMMAVKIAAFKSDANSALPSSSTALTTTTTPANGGQAPPGSMAELRKRFEQEKQQQGVVVVSNARRPSAPQPAHQRARRNTVAPGDMLLDPSLAAKSGQAKGRWKRGVKNIQKIVDAAGPKERFEKWTHSLRRCDPRYQILDFFDQVANRGADALVDCDVHKTGKCTQNCLATDYAGIVRQKSKRGSFAFASLDDAFAASTVFNQAGVFTVWRPTSLDSIRKMICGDGVGKGLDIKGKSAKKGHFSGFVPFLQLHDVKHKGMTRTIPVAARMRVFYYSEEARDLAHESLLSVCVEMVTTYNESQKTIARLKKMEDEGKIKDKEAFDEELEDALNKYMWDMSDPSILPIDDYDPKVWGLDVPQRLFFEAYVMRGDCSRPPGSIHETGRLSEPAFQDMNMETLRNFKPDAPRPVVLLKSHEMENTMDPRYLLIAYEDKGNVKPVVSDFDCFLVGTRRIQFDKPMPKEQVELMKWCVGQIRSILAMPPSNETWTMRWLEALKKAYEDGFHVDFPKYGFADPKSYSIMAHSIDFLSEYGSVRHGAECFNFYFPQDLDEEFLVVTNNQPKGPWKQYSKAGLLEFLSDKIDDGFMFPVNPKWVLCDPGWKRLYDKQIRSKNISSREAMEAWYPSDSGIREMIELCHRKYPHGFQVDDGPYRRETKSYSPLRAAKEAGEEIDGCSAMDMALLEVEHDRVLKKAIKAVNAVLFANRMNNLLH